MHYDLWARVDDRLSRTLRFKLKQVNNIFSDVQVFCFIISGYQYASQSKFFLNKVVTDS